METILDVAAAAVAGATREIILAECSEAETSYCAELAGMPKRKHA